MASLFNEARPAARVDPLVDHIRGLRADATTYRNEANRKAGEPLKRQHFISLATGLDEAADRLERLMKMADAEDAR